MPSGTMFFSRFFRGQNLLNADLVNEAFTL
jgi:hypothetical protein